MAPAAIPSIIATIRALVKSVGLDPQVVDGIDPDIPLPLQGVDSIDYAIIVVTTGDHYNITFSDAELMGLSTLGQFAHLVRHKTAPCPDPEVSP